MEGESLTLTQENASSKRFYFKGNRKVPLITRDFRYFNKFSEKLKYFSKKTGLPFFYNFSVESNMMENGTFPYKTDLSKANIETNRIKSTKWSYHKE